MSTTTATNTEIQSPKLDFKKYLKKAQIEQRRIVDASRCTVIQTLMDLQDFAATDDVEESVLAVISAFPDGVPNTLLKSAFPDAALSIATRELKIAGFIEQLGKRGEDVVFIITEKGRSELEWEAKDASTQQTTQGGQPELKPAADSTTEPPTAAAPAV